MKTSFSKGLLLVTGLLAAIAVDAQSVFKVTSISTFTFGAGYFLMDGSNGRFEIDVLTTIPPASTDNATVWLSTPSGSLSFSTGTGVSTVFDAGLGNPFPDPYYPEPPLPIGHPLAMFGRQYDGTFTSAPSVYAALLAGQGTFTMFSGSQVFATGLISVVAVAVPERKASIIFACGMLWCYWQLRRRTPRALTASS